jgi:hypothetical protein
MIYYSRQAANSYSLPAPLPLPLKLDGPPARVIQAPTDADIIEAGLLPADPVPELGTNEKHGALQLINGRVVVPVVLMTLAEIIARDKWLAEQAITAHIQSRVETYNEAHGLSFRDVYSCDVYADKTGYPHQQFCADITDWNWRVWDAARQILAEVLAGNRTAPSVQELIAELPAYGGVV